MSDPPDSVELLVGGCHVRFNIATRSGSWFVVGPVHTDSEVVPFFEMDGETWATRDEAIAAVLDKATRLAPKGHVR